MTEQQKESTQVIENLKLSILSLEKRVLKLENQQQNFDEKEDFDKEPLAGDEPLSEKDWESWTGASQLGWLGIIISLIGAGYFIRYSFLQNWITGWGQPILFFILALILVVTADRLLFKGLLKFSSCLAVCGIFLFYLSFYWASLHLHLLSIHILVVGSVFVWLFSLFWSKIRKLSVLRIAGFAGAGIIPLYLLDQNYAIAPLFIYFFVIIVISMILSSIYDWKWLAGVATVVVQYFIYKITKSIDVSIGKEALLYWGLWIVVLPALLVFWSGILHILKKRESHSFEKYVWVINNIIFYSYLGDFWFNHKIGILFLIPLIVNGLLFELDRRKFKNTAYDFTYLFGFVFSMLVALTVILPSPFDIMSLCLFSVLLVYFGNKDEGWQLKGVAGAVISWCLIFLISLRFSFFEPNEISFLNLRFLSFIVAFLCFGYEGKMINKDPNAKDVGPLLGQGLFSLGLMVLLAGMGGEVVHLFPTSTGNLFSNKALLGLTFLGGIFAFVVAYIGVVLRLFFIRILAMVFFLSLISKLIFIDLSRLPLLYLIISLAVIGALLGGTSILLKRVGLQKQPL